MSGTLNSPTSYQTHRRRRTWALAVAVLVISLSTCVQRSCESAGDFTITRRKTEALGHREVRLGLVYNGQPVTHTLRDWSVDPERPGRIVYSSAEPCETVVLDAPSRRRLLLSRERDTFASFDEGPEVRLPWSPGGRYLIFGNGTPHVVELATGRVANLTDLLSVGGERLDMHALTWSPAGDRLAAVVLPGGFNDPDRDLVEITASPLVIRYVATKSDPKLSGAILWSPRDISWSGDVLGVNRKADPQRPAASAPRWVRTIPSKAWVPSPEEPCF
jgi:hypothetical protein